MEDQTPENSNVKRDLRKLVVVLILTTVIFGVVQYLAVKTTYISDISHSMYKATLENN